MTMIADSAVVSIVEYAAGGGGGRDFGKVKTDRRAGDVLAGIRDSQTLAARTSEIRALWTPKPSPDDFADVGEYEAAKAARAPYETAKDRLHAVTWGGAFNRRRTLANLRSASGLVFVEIDALASESAAADERARLAQLPFVWGAYASVSGRGVHCVAQVDPTPSSASDYSSAWEAVSRAVGYDGAGDRAVKDISRLAYLVSRPGGVP